MLLVWKGIHPQVKYVKTSDHAHGGEAIHLHRVWESLYTEGKPCQTPETSLHGGLEIRNLNLRSLQRYYCMNGLSNIKTYDTGYIFINIYLVFLP